MLLARDRALDCFISILARPDIIDDKLALPLQLAGLVRVFSGYAVKPLATHPTARMIGQLIDKPPVDPLRNSTKVSFVGDAMVFRPTAIAHQVIQLDYCVFLEAGVVESLVDNYDVRRRDEAGRRAKQHLMGDDPYLRLRRSLLPLVTANLVQLADAFAAFTRKLRYVTKRAADRADTLFIRAHKRARLFKIVCAAGLIDPRMDPLVR